MRNVKKIAFTLVCVLTMALMGGCASSTDAQAYLQALLDVSYKNDSTTFVETKLGTTAEAQELYEQGIDTGVSTFCSGLGVSDEYKEEFRQIYMDILGKARYTVLDAEKQSDGSFVVKVSYEKMNIFKPALELYENNVAALAEEWAASSDSTPSEEEMMEAVVLEFRKSLETVLEEVQYSEPAEMTVRIELADNLYTPNADDVEKLERALFDGE